MNSPTLASPLHSKKEPIKKSHLEDIPSHRTTSKFPNIPPLHVPRLVHIFELIGCQLVFLKWGHTHSIENLINLIEEILRVFTRFGTEEHRWIHSSKVSQVRCHVVYMMRYSKFNLSISLETSWLGLKKWRHSLDRSWHGPNWEKIPFFVHQSSVEGKSELDCP